MRTFYLYCADKNTLYCIDAIDLKAAKEIVSTKLTLKQYKKIQIKDKDYKFKAGNVVEISAVRA